MSLNAYEGARPRERYELIKTLVGRHDVDVLCLQEANGWHEGRQSRLKDFSRSTGLVHYAFGDSNTDSKLVTFSRRRIIQSRIHTNPFYHCAVQTLIESGNTPIKLMNVHLNPFDEDRRLEEIKLIAQIGKDALLLGDMNSLSRNDHYPASLLRTLQEQNNQRYGTGRLRYDVTDYLARQGYRDLAAQQGCMRPTFPAMTGMEQFQYPTRFDYAYAPAGMVSTIENIRVIADPDTRRISDHFPLLLDIAETMAAFRTHQPALQVAAA